MEMLQQERHTCLTKVYISEVFSTARTKLFEDQPKTFRNIETWQVPETLKTPFLYLFCIHCFAKFFLSFPFHILFNLN